MPTIELCCEERYSRLRSAISDKGIVVLLLEVQIIQINIGDPMGLGRQDHQASVIGEQRLNLINQSEMAEIVRRKRSFKVINRPAERSCHNTGVGNDRIKRLPIDQEFIRTGANAL